MFSPTAYDAYLRRKYIPELDGLRALSVLLVITAHMYAVGPSWGLLAGHRGVAIFFVLSGYLITTLALREEAARDRLSLAAFYVRRCCRILPLYYLTLALYCVLVYALPTSRHLRAPLSDALPYYLLYLQELPFSLWRVLASRDLVFFHSWSLGAEEKFYLVWPLLGFVLWRGATSRRLRGTAALALGFVLVPLALTPFGPAAEVVGRMLFCYGSLLAGCVLALLLDDPTWFSRLRPLGDPRWTLAVLAAFLTAHAATPWVAQPWADALNIAYTAAVAALMACVLLGDGWLQRLLRSGPLVFVGQLSYGIYLVHMLCMYPIPRLIPSVRLGGLANAIGFVLACLLSVGVAWVLHRLLESPCIELGRRWSRRILGGHGGKQHSSPRPFLALPRPASPDVGQTISGEVQPAETTSSGR
jgi:peptidoglycan/LPS O-acetylase OafA/YrhL